MIKAIKDTIINFLSKYKIKAVKVSNFQQQIQ